MSSGGSESRATGKGPWGCEMSATAAAAARAQSGRRGACGGAPGDEGAGGSEECSDRVMACDAVLLGAPAEERAGGAFRLQGTACPGRATAPRGAARASSPGPRARADYTARQEVGHARRGLPPGRVIWLTRSRGLWG